MAAKRKSRAMQDQIMELKDRGYSERSIARALKIHRNTVRKYLSEVNPTKVDSGAGVSSDSEDEDFEWRRIVDWELVKSEYARGVTLKQLWLEQCPDVDYVRFWRGFRAYRPIGPEAVIRLQHKPGERCQIDYCDGIDIVDANRGEITKTHLFVGVLPFSSLTYAEFVLDQKLPSFIRSQKNMFAYFGGVTPYVVVDNLKSGVTKAHRYDPDTNRTYCDFGNHMGFAVLPARPRTPHDKASCECGVGVIQEGFFSRVRNRTFRSLYELNVELRKYLEELNTQTMKDHGCSRRDRFANETSHLQPLPVSEFEFSEWKECKVHPDCHIQVGKNFYSVPHKHVGQKVRVRVSAKMIEVFGEDSEPITAHARILNREFRYSTDQRHYPQEKHSTANFSVHQARAKARRIGEKTEKLVDWFFSKTHPLKHLRCVLGILRLVENRKVTTEALEYACNMVLSNGNARFAVIEHLAKHFDRFGARPIPVTAKAPVRAKEEVFLHDNTSDKEHA